MSGKRGILFEIEGCPFAFTLNETAVTNHYGQTNLEAIVPPIPTRQTMGINPFDGTYETGGINITLNREAGILLSRKGTPQTTLTSDIDAVTGTIPVVDASAFPATGTIWIASGRNASTLASGKGVEAIIYAAKTGISFTGSSRGQLGTTARQQAYQTGIVAPRGTKVYGYNPGILGRKCWIFWYDHDNLLSTIRKFTGYIDSFEFTDAGFSLSLLNGSKFLDDAVVMGAKYAGGELVGAYVNVGGYVRLVEELGEKSGANAIRISLDDEATIFPVPIPPWPGGPGVRGRHLQIEEEIIEYHDEIHPATTGIADDRGSSGDRLFFISNTIFQRGDYIKFLDDSGAPQYGVITEVASSGVPASPYRYYHSAPDNPAVGATVTTPGKQELLSIQRGEVYTKAAEHKLGSRVQEVRVLEGDHVDLVLQMLLSVNGDLTNGNYDILPSGWGAALSSALVDTDSFRAIQDYSEHRKFVFTQPTKPRELLAQLARATHSRIFWDETGLLTCKAERELYPDSTTVQTISTDTLERSAIPRWGIRTERIYNLWLWKGNAPRGSEFRDKAEFRVEESVAQYGERPLPEYEDAGLYFSRDTAMMELVATAVLRRWSDPCAQIEPVLVADENYILRPGELVNVVLPHLPDQAGGAGIDTIYEVLRFDPDSNSGTANVLLAEMPAEAQTGLIAPVMEVESVNLPNGEFTAKEGSVTHYAPPAGSIVAVSISGEDGTEDVDYFVIDTHVYDKITFWDVSTFAATPPVTADAEIVSINYTTRVVEAAIPAWLAAGDLAKISDWDTSGAVGANPGIYFICLADEADVPPALGAGDDDAYLWGL